AHQAGIGAKKEHSADTGIGSAQKGLDPRAGQLHSVGLTAGGGTTTGVGKAGDGVGDRRCRKIVSWLTMSRRSWSTARVPASVSATVAAYSFARMSNDSATWLVAFSWGTLVLLSART